MKKLFLLALLLMTTTQLSYAITEEDKSAIRNQIDEVYKYSYYNPEPQARTRAEKYVGDKYFYDYIQCKNNCETEFDNVRAKSNKFSVFSNPAAIQEEARQTFYSCMEKNCNHIKEVEMQECYDYIDKYIELKNKNKKK